MGFLVWDKGISVDECESIINKYKDSEFAEGTAFISTIASFKNIKPQRKSPICWIKENNILVRSLFQFILEANDSTFKYNVFNFSESMSHDAVQFTTYNKDDYYDWHQDIFTEDDPQCINGLNRKISLTANLSDPKSYEGGDLEFFGGEPGPTKIERTQGNVICFDSYTWHRVTPVTKGVRYSLVLWIWGPDFI